MKKNYISEINKIGKIGGTIAKISKIFLNVGFVILIMVTLFVMISPASGITLKTDHKITVTYDKVGNSFGLSGFLNQDENDGKLTIGGVEFRNFEYEDTIEEFKATAVSESYTFKMSSVKWILIGGLIYMAVLIYTFNCLQKLCGLLAVCETPFVLEVADLIKKLAYCIIPIMMSSSITQNISNSVITTGKIDIVLGIDLTMILVILMLLMLSIVFRYGTMLQQESDETL